MSFLASLGLGKSIARPATSGAASGGLPDALALKLAEGQNGGSGGGETAALRKLVTLRSAAGQQGSRAGGGGSGGGGALQFSEEEKREVTHLIADNALASFIITQVGSSITAGKGSKGRRMIWEGPD